MPGHNKLVSLNHEFELTVEPTSELRIYSHRRGTKKMIFWTNNDAHWIGEKWAGFNQQGFFSTFHREKPEDKDPYMTWSTFMWPECRKSPTKDQIPLVLLSDVGALKVLHVPENKIASLNDFISDEGEWANYVVCTPYAGDPEKLREVGQEDMGRLAVLFTGSLRSYKKTCHSQKNMIFDKWPGSKGVDIFFAVLENDVWEGDQVVQKVNWNEVEKDLRTCFGSRFKVLEHVPPPKTSFPGTNDTGSVSDPKMTWIWIAANHLYAAVSERPSTTARALLPPVIPHGAWAENDDGIRNSEWYPVRLCAEDAPRSLCMGRPNTPV